MKIEQYFKTEEELKKNVIIWAVILTLAIIIFYISYTRTYALTELHRFQSPDGNYTVVISRIGTLSLHKNEDFKVEMFSKKEPDYYTFFNANLDTKYGLSFTSIDVSWVDSGAQILFKNNRQGDELYILPFDQSKEGG